VSTWFKVEPAAGKVEPGGEVTLKVTIDPAALHGRPRFKGAFLVRTPSGLSRPVSVYATADFHEELRPAAARDSAYIDAASVPPLAASVRSTPAPNVTGGRYVAWSGKGADPELVARFAVPRAGHYSLLARASVNHDVMQRRVFSLAVDGASEPTRVSVNTDYEWNTGATNFRAIYLQALGELAPGEHELRLRLVSGDLNLNELIVTDNPAAFFIDTWQKEGN
jgi:hypothetical protein